MSVQKAMNSVDEALIPDVARSLARILRGKGKPGNALVASLRQHAKAIIIHEHGLATHMARVCYAISMRAHRLASAGRLPAWSDKMTAGENLKDFSQLGFDTTRGGHMVVDYTNKVYRTLLCYLFKVPGCGLGRQLEHLAQCWRTANPHQPDSEGVLDRQGDLLEIALALGRGHDGIYEIDTSHDFAMTDDIPSDVDQKLMYQKVTAAASFVYKLEIAISGEKGPEGQQRRGALHVDDLIEDFVVHFWKHASKHHKGYALFMALRCEVEGRALVLHR
jgi:hypothetical protein